ncbi:MAG: TonB-dependent receptor [Bacteroidetes bacterium]|nr:TonB-dependent receptor [Bacteroidota bacterium]
MEFLPLENLEQVEVIKGASSALYGSSALNGVINFRTAYAKDKPITKVNSFYAQYDAPPGLVGKWWKGSSQSTSGVSFSHAQKLGNFDLVIGGQLFDDMGYRYLETEKRKRINSNLRYNFKKLPGLSVGVNTNMMSYEGGLFFLWQNFDSAYIPSGRDVQKYSNSRINIDPYVTYYSGKNKFSLRNRYFKSDNQNNKNQNSYSELYYSELQYQRKFNHDLNISSGLVYMEQTILGGALYGNKKGNNRAIYFQADKKFFNRLTISVGLRGEYYKLDTASTTGYLLLMQQKVKLPFQPVFRAGANYQLAEYTFLRASYGQGYRFPTAAEKFISTSTSALTIFPNSSLKPERAYSAEIGIKQGFKILNFKAFADIAAFYTRFNNMIEFAFNVYSPSNPSSLDLATYFKYAGFQAQNVGTGEISGTEISINGTGKIGPLNLTVFGGYTYINPIMTSYNPKIDTLGLPNNNYLKYRQKHLIKGDIQVDYKFVSLGYSLRFQSKTENIDVRFMESVLHEKNDVANGVNFDAVPSTYILPGFPNNYALFAKNVLIQDARMSFQINKIIKLSFIVNNFMNVIYQARPGDMRPPTQYMGQLSFKI